MIFCKLSFQALFLLERQGIEYKISFKEEKERVGKEKERSDKGWEFA
jgi:hypothetical protein